MRNYYVVLGVSKGADLDKIKRAYRTVVKKHHPDMTQDHESKKRFLEIREAYETLSDETKRRQYDAELERQGSSLKVTKAPDIIKAKASLFNEMEDLFSSSVDDFLGGFLPGFFDTDRRRIRGKDLYYEAILSPGEAADGGLYPITIPVLEPCLRCSKSGFLDNFFCPECNGYGRINSEREFSLSIPPNVTHGTEVRLSLEDIGLKNTYLNIVIYIDPDLRDFDQKDKWREKMKLWDRIQRGMEAGFDAALSAVHTITEKAGEGIELTRLRREKARLETQVTRNLAELGNAVYEKISAERLDDITEKLEIKDLLLEIAESEARMVNIDRRLTKELETDDQNEADN